MHATGICIYEGNRGIKSKRWQRQDYHRNASARGLQLKGHSVLLVDSDQQGSARDWRAVDEDNPVPVIGLDRPTLDKDLKSVSDKDYVVIDGSPQATSLAISAIKAADLY